MMFVSGRNVRYVEIPDTIDVAATLEAYVSKPLIIRLAQSSHSLNSSSHSPACPYSLTLHRVIN